MLKKIIIGLLIILIVSFSITINLFIMQLLFEMKNDSYKKQINLIQDKISNVLKQHHERMGAMDRRIDARIRTERNTKKILKDLGYELKIDGEQ